MPDSASLAAVHFSSGALVVIQPAVGAVSCGVLGRVTSTKKVFVSVTLLPTASRAVTAYTWPPIGVGTCALVAVPEACATWVPSMVTVYPATPLTLSVAPGQVSVPGSVAGSAPTASTGAGVVANVGVDVSAATTAAAEVSRTWPVPPIERRTMLCAFSVVRTDAVPLVAPPVTGTVVSTFPSSTTWMLAMAAVGLAGRDQVTGKVAGTALPLVGAVRLAAFGPGGTGPAAGAVNDVAVARAGVPAAALAVAAT